MCTSSVLTAQLPVIGADSLVKHYTAKMTRYLDKESALGDYYSIDLYGISVFPGAAQKKSGQPEYRVNWNDLALYKNIIATAPREESKSIMLEKANRPFLPEFVKKYALPPDYLKPRPTAQLPLKGLKIALDPGHIASDTAMGRMEDKFLLFKTGSGKDSFVVSIAEGILTWKTANALAVLLRSQGAEVFLTRPRPEITAFGKTYAQWRKDDFSRTLDSLLKEDPSDARLLKIKNARKKDEKAIFRYVFRDAELRKRAEIINAFHPALTVIIHYNVDEKNKPWDHPSPKNYNMTFVPGSFQSGELGDAERRFDFLRLLLTDDIENSCRIAGLTALELKSELDVPLAKTTDATYLAASCIDTGLPGVFCRNLSLTRLIQGTLVYGESLFQDNVNECLLLTKNAPLKAEGEQSISGNERIDDVAKAYDYAILLWAKSL
ncbi:MAG: N-acetylmuramoyl-L-alanine amidase [Bacteroidota bacterium]|nr:N-acetylmuramoyl-L-alanine amidase [Bacteroidota bacterium]